MIIFTPKRNIKFKDNFYIRNFHQKKLILGFVCFEIEEDFEVR